MKRSVLGLLALAILATLPAFSQSIYDNGPINGTTDGWTINFGFAVSDTFTTAGGVVTGMSFGAWVFPGDVLVSAEVLIGTSEFAGDIFDGVANFSQSNCVGNQYGFNVCTESASFSGPPNLAAGAYWLTLENATVNTGDPIYWDENSGPSSASENSVGTIPSEAFTLLGACCTTTTMTGMTTPEPSALILLVSGAMASLGLWRAGGRR